MLTADLEKNGSSVHNVMAGPILIVLKDFPNIAATFAPNEETHLALVFRLGAQL